MPTRNNQNGWGRRAAGRSGVVEATLAEPEQGPSGAVGRPERVCTGRDGSRRCREASTSLLEQSHFGYPTRADRTKTEISA